MQMYGLKPIEKANAKLYNPLSLAYLGDSVFELLVRQRLLLNGELKVHELHLRASEIVNATAQSAAVEKIAPILSEEELEILRRGRNANSARVPKNAEVSDYRRATGLESLFGYLHLTGQIERVVELFDLIFEDKG